MLAMVLIAGLEFYAISKGLNGTLLAGVLVLLAGLGGYEAKTIKEKLIKRKEDK